MVRSDLFDCIDRFMRLNGRKRSLPFGGAQMILIGDIYQLPPVVKGIEREIFVDVYKSPYFFDSIALKSASFRFVELEKVFRQKDREFLEILNAIRNNTINEDFLNRLNSRVDEDFIPNKKEMYVHLTTTNRVADNINRNELSMLDGRLYTFIGEKSGDFGDNDLPADICLEVKPYSQIMLINNDSEGRWINGTLGRVLEIEGTEDETYLVVELENKEIVEVSPYTWRIINYRLDKDKKRIMTEEIGRFTQFPVILAWAITIHKSQGKTFDRIILDIGGGTFAHGQIYVALSRCRTLEGVVLRRPIEKRHVIMDRRVVDFITNMQYHQAEKSLPVTEREKILSEAIEHRTIVEIVYLKKTDEKSRRRILPLLLGEMEYNGVKFNGLRAIDLNKDEERTFRLDRILEIHPQPS